MIDTFITIHKNKAEADLWAAQLPTYGQSLVEIKGPFQGVKVDDHTASPPANIGYIEANGCWVVLAKKA
ncbi:MAG: hypothetical protein HXY26_06195 [Hydrogenophilaceae bacterium]|nr:hypothetical protein [Hydrogenophilaceae bacterium]